MGGKTWKLKTSPQPLVFSFAGAASLCGAVRRLYRMPRKSGMLPASLCAYRGRYYLAVGCTLRERCKVLSLAVEFGRCLGPAPVLYAYYAEHGREISRDAVAQLGGALSGLSPFYFR